MKQTAFRILSKPNFNFGGSRLGPNTHPKRVRPIDSKLPLHVVLKADKSTMRLPRNYARVNDQVAKTAKRLGIRIYEYANVGNHLHVLIKLPHRRAWAKFIRALTGRLAQTCGVRWLHRPFTRVVAGWRRAFKIVKDYVVLNRWEAEGTASRADGARLKELRRRLAWTTKYLRGSRRPPTAASAAAPGGDRPRARTRRPV